MDAQRYLNEVVHPTISEFEAEPTSTRRAFLACVVTFHTIDYLAHSINLGNLRENFCRESADFALVDRVAHAFKHVQTGHVNSPSKNPLAADDVIKRPPGAIGDFAIGLSRIGDEVGGVTIMHEPNHDILNAVRGAVDYLRSKCKEQDVG